MTITNLKVKVSYKRWSGKECELQGEMVRYERLQPPRLDVDENLIGIKIEWF